MSLRTPLCDMLEIEHPIMLAGMGGVAYAELAAAVLTRIGNHSIRYPIPLTLATAP